MATKYAIVNDPDFLIKMLGVCKDAEQRGLVRLLDLTGMHVSSLKNAQLVRRGPKTYVSWRRPKTGKTLEALVRPQSLSDIEAFMATRRHHRQTYYDEIKLLGIKAGYESISPMTFRHNRCIALCKKNLPITEIAQVMGCSEAVVVRNYSKLREDQLYQEDEEETTGKGVEKSGSYDPQMPKELGVR